jgi:DNA-directed RNA polymerase subunit RPC12/RpoP
MEAHLTSFYNIEGIMEESEDKIIVFDSYDTVMDANLVKTKLDAYGIPCFLSDENFVGLYPIRNELFPGVRLHIFEKDKDRVNEILAEQNVSEVETIYCPHCGSYKIQENLDKKGLLNDMIATVMIGLFLNPKKSYRCQNCLREFEVLPENTKS